MSQYEVTTEVAIYVQVKALVEADSPTEAINTLAEGMPVLSDPETQKGWKADIKLKTPKWINCTGVKAKYFAQTSGGDKARKVAT